VSSAAPQPSIAERAASAPTPEDIRAWGCGFWGSKMLSTVELGLLSERAASGR